MILVVIVGGVGAALLLLGLCRAAQCADEFMRAEGLLRGDHRDDENL